MPRKTVPHPVPAVLVELPGHGRAKSVINSPQKAARSPPAASPVGKHGPHGEDSRSPSPNPAPKRGPGRPRKHPLPPSPEAAEKRGPGRPRKHPLQPSPEAASKKRRGRSESPDAPPNRKRGRPRKDRASLEVSPPPPLPISTVDIEPGTMVLVSFGNARVRHFTQTGMVQNSKPNTLYSVCDDHVYRVGLNQLSHIRWYTAGITRGHGISSSSTTWTAVLSQPTVAPMLPTATPARA
jgi:hypothetical protein